MNNEDKTIIIGIAGASGSGKSLLSNTIVNELGSNRVVVISEDTYYKDLSHLSLDMRKTYNFDHPDAFDHDLLANHLTLMAQGKTVHVPTYDHALYSRLEKTIEISHHRIIVLEGILIFTVPELRNKMDIRIFIDTPPDICLIRRLNRDILERGRTVDSVMKQYQATVRPMYLQFVEPSKRYADICVMHGGENRIAIDLIQAKMRELLLEKVLGD